MPARLTPGKTLPNIPGPRHTLSPIVPPTSPHPPPSRTRGPNQTGGPCRFRRDLPLQSLSHTGIMPSRKSQEGWPSGLWQQS